MPRLSTATNSPAAAAVGFASRPLNLLANLASIAGLVVALEGAFHYNSATIPLVYLCALSGFLLWRYVRHERWARYAEGVQVMERAMRRLKEASDRLHYSTGEAAREIFFKGLHESLSAFAEAFTLVTGSNCRACIKEVYVEDVATPASRRGGVSGTEEKVLVATISRSNLDDSRRVSLEPSDLLSENSDFEQAFNTLKPFYADDLPKLWLERQYKNSHWREELRQSKDWPYRSAIVWPIEVDPPLGGDPVEGVDRVIAFLCVDSRRRRAFTRRADVGFGGAFAHALYPPLRYALVRGGGPTSG